MNTFDFDLKAKTTLMDQGDETTMKFQIVVLPNLFELRMTQKTLSTILDMRNVGRDDL